MSDESLDEIVKRIKEDNIELVVMSVIICHANMETKANIKKGN
jgi:hypothetical protein